jgi:general stress protein 26
MVTIQSSSSPESADVIRDFLQACRSGVLATSDEQNVPHAAAVYFIVDENYSVLFTTKTDTQKYKDIMQNNQVAFVCYDETSQTTLQINGHAEKVEDENKRQAAMNAIYRFSEAISRTEFPPIEKLYAGDYVTVRIIPHTIKMAVYARPDSEGVDAFESIQFNEDSSLGLFAVEHEAQLQ